MQTTNRQYQCSPDEYANVVNVCSATEAHTGNKRIELCVLKNCPLVCINFIYLFRSQMKIPSCVTVFRTFERNGYRGEKENRLLNIYPSIHLICDMWSEQDSEHEMSEIEKLETKKKQWLE